MKTIRAFLMLPIVLFIGCTTTTRTTTNPDGTTVKEVTRQADGKTLRSLVRVGGDVLSAAAAAEINRRIEDQNRR